MHSAQKAQVAKTRVIQSAWVDSGAMSGQNEFVADLSKRSACYEQRHQSQMQIRSTLRYGSAMWTDFPSHLWLKASSHCKVKWTKSKNLIKSPSFPEQLFVEPIQAGVGHHQEDQDTMARPIPEHLLTRCTPGRSWASTATFDEKLPCWFWKPISYIRNMFYVSFRLTGSHLASKSSVLSVPVGFILICVIKQSGNKLRRCWDIHPEELFSCIPWHSTMQFYLHWLQPTNINKHWVAPQLIL